VLEYRYLVSTNTGSCSFQQHGNPIDHRNYPILFRRNTNKKAKQKKLLTELRLRNLRQWESLGNSFLQVRRCDPKMSALPDRSNKNNSYDNDSDMEEEEEQECRVCRGPAEEG
jgi:hypothetical protein